MIHEQKKSHIFIIICLILSCIIAFLFLKEPYVESVHNLRLVMLDIIENKKFDKSEIISSGSHHYQHEEVSGSFISYLQRAVCGGLVSPVCKKPISPFHRSSSATSCCVPARRTHFTVQAHIYFSDVRLNNPLNLLPIIPHSLYSDSILALTSSVLHWFWHIKSEAAGRTRIKRGSDETLPPPPPQSLSALWWRLEWAKVPLKSDVDVQWNLTPKRKAFSQKSHLIKAPLWDTCSAADIKFTSINYFSHLSSMGEFLLYNPK